MSQKDIFIETLQRHGHSITLPRSMVFELLMNSEPLTMRELALQIVPRVDRASLYRTITLFEQLGIVQRLYIGWKYKIELSDIYSHHHHHVTCLGCHTVVAVDEHPALDTVLSKMAAQTGMQITAHQLELQGYCPDCLLRQQ